MESNSGLKGRGTFLGWNKILGLRTKRANWRGLSSGLDWRWPILERWSREVLGKKESCGVKTSAAGAPGPDFLVKLNGHILRMINTVARDKDFIIWQQASWSSSTPWPKIYPVLGGKIRSEFASYPPHDG